MTLSTACSPVAAPIAGFSAGLYVALIAIAGLGLEVRAMVATAVIGAMFEVAVQAAVASGSPRLARRR
jgi:hypothetical protein